MRLRPHLAEDDLAALLGERFGLDVAGLTFLPVGEDGWVYRVETRGGADWLLKLNQQPPETVLRLTNYLCTAGGLDWIPAPRPALDGSLWVERQGLYLSLQLFIRGDILMDRPPDAGQAGRIGAMLAALHRAGQNLPGELGARLPVESYARHLATAARVLAAALSGTAPGDTQRELAAFIRGKQALIGEILEHCRVAGEQIRRRSPALVLCHADIHEANILVDAVGRLWVIDWDGVMLAPCERDLMFWRDHPHWPAVAAGYGLQAGVDEAVIRYYAYEWVAQEIADYGENIFFLSLSDEQKRDSLGEFFQLFAPGDVVEAALKSPAGE